MNDRRYLAAGVKLGRSQSVVVGCGSDGHERKDNRGKEWQKEKEDVMLSCFNGIKK